MVSGLTVEFGSGVHLVVGPNGIGKTSLLHSIAGTLNPKSGSIMINGRSARQNTTDVILAPGFPPPIPWIRTGMLLEFILSLYPHTRKPDAYKDDLLTQLGLRPFVDKKLGTLSAGTAKKFLLAAAIVAAPPIMLFDEPTNEIDSHSTAVFLRYLTEIAGNTIVVITTHQVAVFQPLAPTVLRLGDGNHP